MRGWLAKVPTGSVSVEMCCETTTGLVQLAAWERAEVEELRGQADGDVATAMIAAAQEYADGEETRQKFVIRWCGKRGKFLKTVTHWAKPAPAEEGDGIAVGISDATIIRDLLRSNNEKDKVLLNALTASAAAYERTISMLSTRLQQAYEVIDETKAKVDASAPAEIVVSETAEAEILQRTEALKVLTEKLPDMIDLGITAVANKLLEKEEGAAAAAAAAQGATNGAAATPTNGAH